MPQKAAAAPVVSGAPPADYPRGRELHTRVPPERWCVTREDLEGFLGEVEQRYHAGEILNDPHPKTKQVNPLHDDPDIGPNMHAVNRYVICPVTLRAGGMSWSLMLHEDGLEVDFFVTHNWQEGVFEFCRRVLRSWPPGTRHMWCCFLANPQPWRSEDLKGLLGTEPDLSDSPFCRALHASSCQMLLVVPNTAESIYARLWCVEEARRAIDLELPVWLATDCGILHWPLGCQSVSEATRLLTRNLLHRSKAWSGQDSQARDVAEMQLTGEFKTVADAVCSDPDDQRRILSAISGQESRINAMILRLAAEGKWLPSASSPLAVARAAQLEEARKQAAALLPTKACTPTSRGTAFSAALLAPPAASKGQGSLLLVRTDSRFVDSEVYGPPPLARACSNPSGRGAALGPPPLARATSTNIPQAAQGYPAVPGIARQVSASSAAPQRKVLGRGAQQRSQLQRPLGAA